MNAIRHVTGELAKDNMMVDQTGRPRDSVYLLNNWHRTLKVFLYVGAVLALLALAVSWREWSQNFSYDPALDLEAITRNPGLLPGWNLAPSVNGSNFFHAAKAFGFFAFTAQGVVASFYILFICVIYGFATWIYRLTTDSTEDELVPNTLSSDPRKGFEKFEPLIETLLSAALAFFVVLYLTRLDDEFVLSDSHGFWRVYQVRSVVWLHEWDRGALQKQRRVV